MDRQQTLQALKNIAARIAEEENLDIITAEDMSLGIWDNPDFTKSDVKLSDIMKKVMEKMGETYQDIHFTHVPYEDYDLRKDFKVTLGYWFDSPKISVGTQWGDGFASLTFSDKNFKDDTKSEEFEMSSSQIFKEGGIPLFNKVMEYWHEEKERCLTIAKESTDYESAPMESPENEEEIESKMALMADFSYYSEYASSGGVFTATTSRKYGALNGKYYIVEKYDDEISDPSISTNELSLADYLSQLAKEYMESYRNDTEYIAAYGSVDALETNAVAKAHIYDDFIRDRIINDYVDAIEDFAVTGLPVNEKGETIICLVDNNGISFEFNDSTGQLYLINKNNIFRTIEIKMTDNLVNLVKKIDAANDGSVRQANAEKTKPKEIERL